MLTHTRSRDLPDDLLDPATARSAVALACRAPSVHNTQPWRWRIGPTTVHLFADPSRRLDVGDPYERDLVISCGAALHHLQVALRAAGWHPRVHRLPNPARPEHLAAVEVQPREPTADDLALAAAIPRRRTDRRAFSSWPVPDQLRRSYQDLAGAAGALLLPLDGADQRWRLARIAEVATMAQALTPGAVAELHAWSGRHRGADDGVPAANVGAGTGERDVDSPSFPLRNTGGADLVEEARVDSWADDGSWLTVLSTREDDRLAHLRAGEALGAVLLEATVVGMVGQPVTQLLQLRELRARVAAELTGGAVPQVLLRVGWAPGTRPPVPRTGRRPVDDVLDPWDAPWPDPARSEEGP